MKYALHDNTNDKRLSHHRSPDTAGCAASRVLRAVKRNNPGAYLRLQLLSRATPDSEYKPVDPDSLDGAEFFIALNGPR